MKHPIIYIQAGAGSHTHAAHFVQLAGGHLRVVSNMPSAIRTLDASGDPQPIILFERRTRKIDLQNIRLLRSQYPQSAIILLTGTLDATERKAYLEAGTNSALRPDTDAATFDRTIRFITEYAFRYKPVHTAQPRLTGFRMPLWKRTFDVLASAGAIVLLSPVLLATAVAVRLDSPGPVIYRSKRVGSNYRVFDFLKFRSMRTDADSRLREMEELNQYAGQPQQPQAARIALDPAEVERLIPAIDGQGLLVSDDFVIPEQEHLQRVGTEQRNAFVKFENDPRITRTGRFIRKYSIDELPQLFNILRGDMSVVGNRPLPLYEAEHLTSDEYIDRFMCPSGLTGLWQVEKRGGAGKLSPEERKRLDIYYAQHLSPLLDLKIILKTFTAFIQKENV